MSGAIAYHGGLAAEDQVAAHYGMAGCDVCNRRWRGRGGEIDIVARDGDTVVFVEVKRSRSHARAAERVTPRQRQRLFDAAGEFLAREPAGLDSECRFDVALVDGAGQISILENAFT